LLKEATARGLSINVQRNSSRGMFWLEPLERLFREPLRSI